MGELRTIVQTLSQASVTGYVIINGNGYLIARGRSVEDLQIIEEKEVKNAKHHNKGGQSSLRFSRLANESDHNYITKVIEALRKHFKSEGRTTIASLIIGGTSDRKTQLQDRLKDEWDVRVITVAFGGERGLRQCVQATNEWRGDERKKESGDQLMWFRDMVDSEPDRCVFGEEDVTTCMQNGVLEVALIPQDVEGWEKVGRVRTERLNRNDVQSLYVTAFLGVCYPHIRASDVLGTTE